MKITTEKCIQDIVDYFIKNGEKDINIIDVKNWKRISKSGTGENILRKFENKKTGNVIDVISNDTEIKDIIEGSSDKKIITKFGLFNKDLEKSFNVIKMNDDATVYKNVKGFFKQYDLEKSEIAEITDKKNIKKGENIMVIEPYHGKVDYVIELNSDFIASCQGFSDGLSSDHWIIFESKKDNSVFVIENEPVHFKSVKALQDEYDIDDIDDVKTIYKKYNIKHIFDHV